LIPLFARSAPASFPVALCPLRSCDATRPRQLSNDQTTFSSFEGLECKTQAVVSESGKPTCAQQLLSPQGHSPTVYVAPGRSPSNETTTLGHQRREDSPWVNPSRRCPAQPVPTSNSEPIERQSTSMHPYITPPRTVTARPIVSRGLVNPDSYVCTLLGGRHWTETQSPHHTPRCVAVFQQPTPPAMITPIPVRTRTRSISNDIFKTLGYGRHSLCPMTSITRWRHASPKSLHP